MWQILRMVPLKIYAQPQVRSPRKWHSSIHGGVKEDFSEVVFELRLEELMCLPGTQVGVCM